MAATIDSKNPSLKTRKTREPWIRPVDSLVLLYQVVMSGLILAGNLSFQEKLHLVGNHVLACLALVVFLWNIRNFTNPIFRFAREFYPLAAMLFFYREVGLLVHQYFDWTLDEWLFSVDNEMGKIGMRIWNQQQFYPPSRLLNELFSIGYSFYFFLMPLSALVLYFRAPLPRFRAFMFSLSFTYFLHYILFIFLPAESPRFYIPGLRESLQGYWVSDWLQTAVENNAFPGGSFPSSHIAASVICLMAFPYFGKWRFGVLLLTLMLFAGTIYGRYHYFVDVVAGLGVGLCCYIVAPWLEKRWPFIFDEEGFAREQPREAFN
jgi:membrane-associated phospholipid phosphatase